MIFPTDNYGRPAAALGEASTGHRVRCLTHTDLRTEALGSPPPTPPALMCKCVACGARPPTPRACRCDRLSNRVERVPRRDGGSNPERYQGFATRATPEPKAAARELERTVTKLVLNGRMLFGRTRKSNLDCRNNMPIFETTATLWAPLYLPPQSHIPAVRDAIYSSNGAFATFGIG